jgi:hypothetical protein
LFTTMILLIAVPPGVAGTLPVSPPVRTAPGRIDVVAVGDRTAARCSAT